MMIGEGRRKVREMGFDPLIVRNYNHSVGLFSVQLTNTWVHGVSSFYRVGNLTLGLENNTITSGIYKLYLLFVYKPLKIVHFCPQHFMLALKK